ncbi:MAG: hypothetical protein KH354_00845 [Clostridiales bacterium]|nr:hypothetical protein [Clostridiales bacterium]
MNPYSPYDPFVYKKLWHEGIRNRTLYGSCGVSQLLPSRIPVNQAGELALEEEERTGKVDLCNPNIIDTSLWEGYMEGYSCACAEVNGEERHFFLTFTKEIGYTNSYARVEGIYSKQGNDFHLIPKEKRIWVNEKYRRVLVKVPTVSAFYTMDQWERNGGFKGRINGQEVSYEVYNRFFEENQPMQPLPLCVLQNRSGEINSELVKEYGAYDLLTEERRRDFLNVSLWDGFMTTRPCVYAKINGERRPFYLAFLRRRDKYKGYYCRFEGVYSVQGDNIQLVPIEGSEITWVSTDNVCLGRQHVIRLIQFCGFLENKRIYLHSHSSEE